MPTFMYFILAVVALIVGYVVYGTLVAKIFGADPNRPTPAQTMADGVDYVEMPMWKVWLIQLLNIAGVGPVFGPILGALYGPSALIWIVIGTIFAGAVHDYFSGMLSLRYGGASATSPRTSCASFPWCCSCWWAWSSWPLRPACWPS